MSLPVNHFVELDDSARLAGMEILFELTVAAAFIVASLLILSKLVGKHSPFTVWSAGAAGGLFSVLAACGIAEMFTYMDGFSPVGDSFPTVPVWSCVAICMIAWGAFDNWLSRRSLKRA